MDKVQSQVDVWTQECASIAQHKCKELLVQLVKYKY